MVHVLRKNIVVFCVFLIIAIYDGFAFAEIHWDLQYAASSVGNNKYGSINELIDLSESYHQPDGDPNTALDWNLYASAVVNDSRILKIFNTANHKGYAAYYSTFMNSSVHLAYLFNSNDDTKLKLTYSLKGCLEKLGTGASGSIYGSIRLVKYLCWQTGYTDIFRYDFSIDSSRTIFEESSFVFDNYEQYPVCPSDFPFYIVVEFYGEVGSGWGQWSFQENTATADITVQFDVAPLVPTLIALSDFGAIAGNKAVNIFWTTDSEIDNSGYNIYRSTSEDGEYVRINEDLIPAEGSPTQGASYTVTDDGLQNRKTYWYKLEDIDLNGTSTMHGPVSATPRLIYGVVK